MLPAARLYFKDGRCGTNGLRMLAWTEKSFEVLDTTGGRCQQGDNDFLLATKSPDRFHSGVARMASQVSFDMFRRRYASR